MKRLLLLTLLCAPLAAQNPNPQSTFAQTMASFNPATWLRFNEAAEPYFDSISGNAFLAGSPSPEPYLNPNTLTANNIDGIACGATPLQAGTLRLLQRQFFSAPGSGNQVTIAIANQSGSTITIVHSFTLTTPNTTTLQTFYGGVDFTPVTVTAGQLLCEWVAPGAQGMGYAPGSGTNSWGFASSTLPSGPQTYTALSSQLALYGYVDTGTITPQQPGFDLRQKNNFSAAFPYNTFVSAPNGTTGNYDWNVPWSIYVYLDKLSIDRANGGTLVLASKGNYTINGATGWVLDLEPDTADGFPLAYRVCMRMQNGVGVSPFSTQESACTGGTDNVASDGPGYAILFTNAGTGWIGDDHLYVNGIEGGGAASSPQYQAVFNNGFGWVQLSVSGGTGYPTSTALTYSGGGAHCVVNASMLSSGGVPNGSFSSTQNSGCTSSPTCGLAASSGSGATVTCTLVPSTLATPNVPLLIGGISTDASQGPRYIDEFAMFPTALTVVGAVNLWYQVPWYQNFLGAPPANPPLVIFSDDGAPDPDNQYALGVAIAADLQGYIKLIGVVNQDAAGSCPTMWRQMLDQAGLNHVPVGVTFTFSGGGSGCNSGGTELSTFNASTPTASSAYMPAVTLYRTLLAKYSSTPVELYNSSNFPTDLANFLQSPADGISSLTGQQLWNQDATNGAKVYMQGNFYCTPTSPPAASPCSATYTQPSTPSDWTSLQYVLTHNGSMPIMFIAGNPSATGQDLPESRTGKDPLYLYGVAQGYRAGWDTLAFLSIITNTFTNGLNVAVSGGTGYANLTPVTQTGGGAGCPTQIGWLQSASGVPSAVLTQGGANSASPVGGGGYSGTAQSCTSLPTLSLPGATGTGVTLTPSLTTLCGTITITIGSPNTTFAMSSATCSNHYFVLASQVSVASQESPWFSWFANGLMDPPPQGQPRESN